MNAVYLQNTDTLFILTFFLIPDRDETSHTHLKEMEICRIPVTNPEKLRTHIMFYL